MKTGYVKTEIIRFLDEKREEGQVIHPQFVMESLPEIFRRLKEDPEKPLEGCRFEEFQHWCNVGYTKALMWV